MARRNHITLGVLVAVLLLLVYVLYQSAHPLGLATGAGEDRRFVPLAVDSPALRLDLLQQLKEFQYQGPRRNIFSVVTAPPPPPARVEPPPAPAPAAPAPPPPLVIPATLVGFVADPKTGTRRALFSAEEDVYSLAVGEVLLSHFRLVQMGENTAQMEEVSSGRKATLTLVESPGAQ